MKFRPQEAIVDDRTIVFRTKTCHQALVRLATQLTKANAPFRKETTQIMELFATLLRAWSHETGKIMSAVCAIPFSQAPQGSFKMYSPFRVEFSLVAACACGWR